MASSANSDTNSTSSTSLIATPMESDERGTTSFERSVFTEFFELVKTDGRNIHVKCRLCHDGKKTYSTSTNSTANLKKHLQVRTIIHTHTWLLAPNGWWLRFRYIS
jgi:hypothetical protein